MGFVSENLRPPRLAASATKKSAGIGSGAQRKCPVTQGYQLSVVNYLSWACKDLVVANLTYSKLNVLTT
jgi:hypothetical protein